MNYPNTDLLYEKIGLIRDYAALRTEQGAGGIEKILDEAEANLSRTLEAVYNTAIDPILSQNEPNDLETIKKLRPRGSEKILKPLDTGAYRKKLEGAFMARAAGCTLGAIVEMWSVDDMRSWAEYIGDNFPPADYWRIITAPSEIRYTKNRRDEYTREKIKVLPADDDIAYTLLGLFIVEDYGIKFTTGNVGEAWKKYLPLACTAEEAALKNLREGVSWEKAAELNNPWQEWIGADIRSDGFAYIAAGNPEAAAEMAYRDAYISHRRNGIYGGMFFAAAQAAAFCVDNAVDALEIGLAVIPENCALANDIKWALETGKTVCDYRDARALVDERFNGMGSAHTRNNACLTIFGLMIGGNDVSKVISETVAMGRDNDCTAATAGSIVGAIAGIDNVDPKWYKCFNNDIVTYITGREHLKIDNILSRFEAMAEKYR